MPRRIADPSKLRVSDEQRDQVASQLREHFATGRLTQDDLDERLQAAYNAKTGGDLEALLDDLPALPLSPAELRAERVDRRRRIRRHAIEETSGSFGAFGICTFIWLASGAHGEFWPVWVGIVPAIALFRNVPRLIGISSEEDEEEREDQRRRSRADRRELRRERRGELRRPDDR